MIVSEVGLGRDGFLNLENPVAQVRLRPPFSCFNSEGVACEEAMVE